MNLSERILRIATSHWTERSCFALTVAAALTGDGRMWIAAGETRDRKKESIRI